MIRLSRKGVEPPPEWAADVAAALRDPDLFWAKAREFEALGLSHETRRQGFKAFAPDALPVSRGKPDFKPIWGAAKDAIAGMSKGKCAYCETKINAKRSGQVEHFRPKSRFPTLAYDWANYFLACGGCNGPKRDKWPARGYVQPDRTRLAGLFRFERDGTMATDRKTGMAPVTLRDLELNRGWLVEARESAIAEVLEDWNDLIEESDLDDPDDAARVRRLGRRKLKRLRDPKLPYSAALTQSFLRAWDAVFPRTRP